MSAHCEPLTCIPILVVTFIHPEDIPTVHNPVLPLWLSISLFLRLVLLRRSPMFLRNDLRMRLFGRVDPVVAVDICSASRCSQGGRAGCGARFGVVGAGCLGWNGR